MSRHHRDRSSARRRAAWLASTDRICVYCGGLATTVDDRVPLALGGADDLSNWVPACRPCNSAKAARPAPPSEENRGRRLVEVTDEWGHARLVYRAGRRRDLR